MTEKPACPDCGRRWELWKDGICRLCHYRRLRGLPLLKDRPRCKHCALRVSLPGTRGLCGVCHTDKDLLDRYPVANPGKFTTQGVGFRAREGAPDPCDHLPGSEEKLQELEDRARKGLALFHPGDNCYRGPGSEKILPDEDF
jgi:hypothetical protein